MSNSNQPKTNTEVTNPTPLNPGETEKNSPAEKPGENEPNHPVEAAKVHEKGEHPEPTETATAAQPKGEDAKQNSMHEKS